MIKPEPTRPRLVWPPRRVNTCLGSKEGKAVLEDQPPRRHALPSTASGARWRVGPLPRTTPVSVTGLTRMANRKTSLLSPSILQRSPGKKGGGDSGQMAYLTGYGASLGGTLCYTHNPTLGISSCTFLHTTSDDNQMRCNTQHKHTTNTTTMVVKLPTPLTAWI
jgi:hypothetical protein